ncbi:MAG: HTH-type transcriptional activator IlvY [Lentisphaeria bacterium]
MELRSLKYFLILSDTLNFGRASQRCNISPSALTRMIQRLEDEVGSALFERDNRVVRMTRAGQLLKEYAQTVLYGWEDFQDMLEEASEELRGRISLYCSVTACYTVLPALINKFREEHPMVHLNLETGDAADALVKLMEGEVDVTVAALPDHLPDTVEFFELVCTPLVVVVPKGVYGEKFNKFQWDEEKVVLPRHGLSRSRIEKYWRENEYHPQIYGEVSGNEAIIALVSLGCGVGIVPQLVYEKSPLKSEVDILVGVLDVEPYRVGLCVLKKRLENPLIAALFGDIIKN